MISLRPSKVQELKFSLRQPPQALHLSSQELSQRHLDRFDQDGRGCNLTDVWKKAQEQLESVGRLAQRQLSYHDNDYGAVGKYDRNPAIGHMEYVDHFNGLTCDVQGHSQQIRLPGHWWQRARFTTAATDFSQEDRNAQNEVVFQRHYSAAFTDDKASKGGQKLGWERATVVGSSAEKARTFLEIEVDYRSDTMIVRTGQLQ